MGGLHWESMLKITEYLSIYAALLSSIVFIWNIRRATSRVKIQFVFSVDQNNGEPASGLSVVVSNPSAQTIHLSSISPLVPSTSSKPDISARLKHIAKYRRLPTALGWVHTQFDYFDIDDGCPVSIEPGRSHRIFVSGDKVKEMLMESECKQLRARAQDELWRNKYSKPYSTERFC